MLTEYALLAAVVFFAAHGLAISLPIFNVDDWVQVTHRSGWGWSPLGRWGQDLLYNYGLASSFSHSAQAVGAFVSFLALPLLILTRNERTLSATVALFAMGVCFPFWVDALNFSAHVLAFPLSLTLSVSALMLACNQSEPITVQSITSRLIPGSILFFLAISIYQPLGAFGIIVPILFAFRVTQISTSQLPRLLLSAGLVVVGGSILFLIFYKGYFTLFPANSEDSRAGFTDLNILGLKLVALPSKFADTLLAGELGESHPLFPALQLTGAAILSALYFAVTILLITKKHYFDAIRVIIFVPLAIIAPIFGPWLVVKIFPWYPPRALAGFNFAFAATTLVLWFELQALLKERYQKIEKIICKILIAILGTSACIAATTSSKLWTDQWRVFQRDVALATSIFDTYAKFAIQQQVPAPTLVLIGESQYKDMYQNPSVTCSVTRSAFNASWSRKGIFHELFPNRVKVELRDPKEAKQDCEAFPAQNSVQIDNREIVVCLERVVHVVTSRPTQAESSKHD